MKLISIIIPHYNSWDMLSELLKTIPNKREIEVIVIDDHSENSTKHIPIFKTEFPNVIIEKNKSDKKGAGAARNIGLSIASGKWLLFADADDLFAENFLEIILQYVESDFDLIYFSPDSFIDRSNEESTRHKMYEGYINNYLNNAAHSDELKLRYYFEPPWSKLVRREIVKKNNIKFEEVMVANDVLFSAKIGYYSKEITASRDEIYIIRQSKGSLTSVISEKTFKQRFASWIDYVMFLKEKLTLEELKLLNISAVPQLLTVIRNKLGSKNIIYIINQSYANNISIINKKLFNPFFIIKSILKYHKI